MLNRQAFPKSPSNMPRLQRELVDVPDCVRFGIPWQWPAIADIRSWPFTRRFFRFEAVSFLEVGNFFGEKGRTFWMMSLRFGWQVQVDNRYDMYVTSTCILPPAVGGDFWTWDTHFSVTPNFFQTRFNLLNPMDEPIQRDWYIQIFLFEDQWHLPVTQKTAVDDWANLGRICRTWKTFPKNIFFSKDTHWLYWWKFIYLYNMY